MEYRHTEDMGEISGFGGGYEDGCQDMLEAGCGWLDGHKGADLRASTYKNVYGILNPENDETKALEDAVVSAAPDCTAAMQQAVMSRLFYIAAMGWKSYCSELRKPAQ